MVKERKITEEILVFNRSVKATELNLISKEYHFKTIVANKIIIDEDLNIECNLYVLGEILRKHSFSEYDININGDLICYGDVHCNNIKVMGIFISEGMIYSKNISVGEDFLCYDKVNSFGHDIAVAGDIEVFAIKAESIITMSDIIVYESISAKNVRTGY